MRTTEALIFLNNAFCLFVNTTRVPLDNDCHLSSIDKHGIEFHNVYILSFITESKPQSKTPLTVILHSLFDV